MYLFSNFKISKQNYFSFLIALIPLSFVAGNMIINLNILIIIISALIIFGKKIFTCKYNLLDKSIILFFIFLLINGIYNDISIYFDDIDFSTWRGHYFTVVKSIFFFRFLLLYFVIKYLINSNFFNFKIFFLSCSLISIFVCLDILVQLLFGKDIFGYEAPEGFRKLSGPFGNELIAGGFIQRFSIFSFFVIPLFYNKVSNRTLKMIIPLLMVLFLFGLIFSGNRMPLLLFIFLISLITIFQNQTRKYLLPFITLLLLIFILAFNFNSKVRNNFLNFYNQITKITVILVDDNKSFENAPPYLKEFASFYETWRLNKFIGGGIKNFRYFCHLRENIDPNSKFICNMHPHNYYLEILADTGLVGLMIIIFIFSIILYNSLIKKYFLKTNLKNNNLITPFIFLFFVEIFPIKSTGSFFTTGNATYLFLILGILVTLFQKDNLIDTNNKI